MPVIDLKKKQPTAAGYATVYPSNTTRPTASNLNFSAGQTVPNLVVVRLGTNGKVKIFNSNCSTHFIVYVSVLFYKSATPRDLHSFPTRRSSDLDTRNGTGGISGKIGPGATA